MIDKENTDWGNPQAIVEMLQAIDLDNEEHTGDIAVIRDYQTAIECSDDDDDICCFFDWVADAMADEDVDPEDRMDDLLARFSDKEIQCRLEDLKRYIEDDQDLEHHVRQGYIETISRLEGNLS